MSSELRFMFVYIATCMCASTQDIYIYIHLHNHHRYLQAQEWELFRVFDSMEFELMDSFKTSQGISSEVNLSAEMAAVVASLALQCIMLLHMFFE